VRRILLANRYGGLGGAGLALAEIVRALPEHGWEPLVVFGSEGELAERLAAEGFRVEQVPMPVLTWTGGPVRWVSNGAAWVRSTARLLRLLQRERPAVVHLNAFQTQVHGLLAARLARAPVVCAMHETIPPTRVNRLLVRGVGRLADRVVAISRTMAEQLRACGVPDGKVEVIYPALRRRDTSPPEGARDGDRALQGDHSADRWRQPVPPTAGELRAELGVPAGVPVIGYVGAISPLKDVLTLVAAAPQVLARYPETRFLLVGGRPTAGDPYWDEVVARIANEGLQERVLLTGPRGDVPAILGLLDAFVLPSTSEGLPLSVLEAMMAGVPVVVTPVGGVPEMVVDGASGRLFPVGDAQRLAEHLVALLADPEQARALGEAGRRRAEALFDPRQSIERMVALYEEVGRA